MASIQVSKVHVGAMHLYYHAMKANAETSKYTRKVNIGADSSVLKQTLKHSYKHLTAANCSFFNFMLFYQFSRSTM